VEALQAGAAGQFGFQAQWTAQMVRCLSNLMHHSHVWRLDLSDVMNIYSRLPEQIMEMVMDRARKSRWDIQVDVNSGVNGQTNRKLQRAQSLFLARSASGEPIMPLRMAREAANIDHEEATLAFREEMQPTAPLQVPQENGGPGGAGPPPGDGPPNNGA
jgi:hypothetical protein